MFGWGVCKVYMGVGSMELGTWKALTALLQLSHPGATQGEEALCLEPLGCESIKPLKLDSEFR